MELEYKDSTNFVIIKISVQFQKREAPTIIEMEDCMDEDLDCTQDLLGRGEPGLQRHVLRTDEGEEGGD